MSCRIVHAVVLVLLSCTVSCASAEPPTALADAAALLEDGDAAGAVTILRAALDANATGEAAPDLRLALGNALVIAQRYDEAVPVLEQAGADRELAPYAAVLAGRATSRGKLAARADAVSTTVTRVLADPSTPAALREELEFLAVELAGLRKDDAALERAGSAFLGRWPSSSRRDDVLWHTARALEAQGRARTAYDRYAELWHDHPGSPWGRLANRRLLDLEKSQHLPPWNVPAARRRAFIRTLQSIGMHDEALAEIARFRKQGPPDDALRLEADSQLALRHNDLAVRAAAEVRKRWPRGAAAPAAALIAIRALRRDERTADVRDWVAWVENGWRGSEEARDARYQLGVHLVNAHDLAGGVPVLESIASTPGKFGDDALWKLAWSYRGAGDTAKAVDRLRTLLTRFPRSGYRKGAGYWIARFTAADDPAGATSLWRTVLRENPHEWYGFAAREALVALGDDPGPGGSDARFPASDPFAPGKRSAGVAERIVRLRRCGLFGFAADELRALPGADRDLDLQFGLALLYAAAGQHESAQRVVQRSFGSFAANGSTDPALVPPAFWRVVFPLEHRAAIDAAVARLEPAEHRVDAALVAALIHNESGFAARAISGAGAIGLMQLMPEAAARLAHAHALPVPSREDLFDPATNIRFGTLELADRVRDFAGAWAPAVASYNAGIGPAREWWNGRPPEQSLEEFVENIPYLETRLYVKNVLADYRNYSRVYRSK